MPLASVLRWGGVWLAKAIQSQCSLPLRTGLFVRTEKESLQRVPVQKVRQDRFLGCILDCIHAPCPGQRIGPF